MKDLFHDKEIIEQIISPNMFKINLKSLLWTVENIERVNVITVPEAIKADAGMALDRMLALAPEGSIARHSELIKERQAAAR